MSITLVLLLWLHHWGLQPGVLLLTQTIGKAQGFCITAFPLAPQPGLLSRPLEVCCLWTALSNQGSKIIMTHSYCLETCCSSPSIPLLPFKIVSQQLQSVCHPVVNDRHIVRSPYQPLLLEKQCVLWLLFATFSDMLCDFLPLPCGFLINIQKLLLVSSALHKPCCSNKALTTLEQCSHPVIHTKGPVRTAGNCRSLFARCFTVQI